MTGMMWIIFVRMVAENGMEIMAGILEMTDNIVKTGICPR